MTKGSLAPRWHRRPLFALAGMFAAAMVGAAVQVLFPGAKSDGFFDLPEARTWVLANSVLLALSVGVGLWTFQTFRWWASGVGRLFRLATACVYLAILLFTMFLPENSAGDLEHPVTHHGTRVAFLVLVVMLGAFPSFATMVLITDRLFRSPDDDPQRTDARGQLELLLRARADMGRALAALASLMTTAVVATGAYRVALEAWGGGGSSLSPYAVAAYGGYLSALIVAVYVPTRLVWRAAGTALRDELHPVPRSSLVERAWIDGRQSIDELLGLGASSRGGLQSTLEMAAPLAAAFLPLLV